MDFPIFLPTFAAAFENGHVPRSLRAAFKETCWAGFVFRPLLPSLVVVVEWEKSVAESAVFRAIVSTP